MAYTSGAHYASYMALLLLLLMVLAPEVHCNGLSAGFYYQSCPDALPVIRREIRRAIAAERRMAASLLRLHFHDCFVQGCDASIMLDDSSSFESEKDAAPNMQSVRGFEVIERAKAELEKVCPGVVSCADVLAVAARDASEYVGGPSWNVKLGRRDSTKPNRELAETELPSFTASLDQLIEKFRNKGLSARDMVALSGAHTIGLAACATFRDRVHSEDQSNIDANFARMRQRGCPAEEGDGDRNTAALDLVTPQSFDNTYYKNLLQKKGLLQSDQVLFQGGSTDATVLEYSKSSDAFYADFAAAMVRMGDISPLTGSAGQIRKTCNVVN